MPRMPKLSLDCQHDKHGTLCKSRPRWWLNQLYCDCICHKKNVKWRGPDRCVIRIKQDDDQWYRLGNYRRVYYESKETSHNMVQISTTGTFTVLWSTTQYAGRIS